MPIPDKLLEMLNRQLNSELYSAYLYLSMAAYFESKGLRGFASWMEAQAREELGHAMRIYRYINDRGGRVVLEAVEKPPSTWPSVLDAVKHALEHEKKVTRSIEELFREARSQGDAATEVFLHWFIEEQVEEEALFSDLVWRVEMAGEQPQALLMLDSMLGERGRREK